MSRSLKRLSLMWSVYNLILVTLIVFVPQLSQFKQLVDFVKASAVIVGIYWAFAYVLVGPDEIYKMGQSLWPGIEKPPYYAIDFITHFLPIIVLGPPVYKESYILASCFITVWYTATHEKIKEIYEVLPLNLCDIVVYGGFVACITFYCLALFNS